VDIISGGWCWKDHRGIARSVVSVSVSQFTCAAVAAAAGAAGMSGLAKNALLVLIVVLDTPRNYCPEDRAIRLFIYYHQRWSWS
jgi:hypothetical protein